MHARLITLIYLTLAIGAKAQQGLIDPNWVYTTPLHWKHAPRGIDESATFGALVVLYPDGQYLEIRAGLIRRDKDKSISVSAGDGLVLSTGDWSRTDEQAIRIHTRDVMWSTETVSKHKCQKTPDGPRCEFEGPHPEPFTTDTCALAGHSATHLAATILCHRLILTPARLNLDLPGLQSLAHEAFSATPSR
jgi:hypothetical protein